MTKIDGESVQASIRLQVLRTHTPYVYSVLRPGPQTGETEKRRLLVHMAQGEHAERSCAVAPSPANLPPPCDFGGWNRTSKRRAKAPAVSHVVPAAQKSS